jgi:t-SNARE complex subunit (syntaxin)
VDALCQTYLFVACCQERNVEAKAIAEDAMELRELFQEVNVLVAEQHEQIEKIEKTVDDSADRVKAGNQNVVKVRRGT